MINCKICGCVLPEEYFEKGDYCPKCEDLMMDARLEGEEVENGN